ncbi:MAG: putative metal-binding motif-containing protein [Myxococcota bacterium]
MTWFESVGWSSLGLSVALALSTVTGCAKVDPGPGQPGDAEVCDGVDNDGDDSIDEDWPLLGTPCGEQTGECSQGLFACADSGTELECQGAVGPATEVCDGLDNDCNGTADDGLGTACDATENEEVCDGSDNDANGLIDDGVLEVLTVPTFNNRAGIAPVPGGFLFARIVGDRLVVETYDVTGSPTRLDDSVTIAGLTGSRQIEADSVGGDVLLAFGNPLTVAYVSVRPDLSPTIEEVSSAQDDWFSSFQFQAVFDDDDAGRLFGRADGAYGITSFSIANVAAVATTAPTAITDLDFGDLVSIEWPYVTWRSGTAVSVAELGEDGQVALERDVASDFTPSLHRASDDTLGLSTRSNDGYSIYELDDDLTCSSQRYCGEEFTFTTDALEERAVTLGYVAPSDTWVVAAGPWIDAVGRATDAQGVSILRERVADAIGAETKVVISGSTAAVIMSSRFSAPPETFLSFVGCLSE